jgi:hypothetical protein
MLVECEDCTTAYPPDVAVCPHCGTPNPLLAEDANTDEAPAEELPPNVRRSRKTETVQLPDQKENE